MAAPMPSRPGPQRSHQGAVVLVNKGLLDPLDLQEMMELMEKMVIREMTVVMALTAI